MKRGTKLFIVQKILELLLTVFIVTVLSFILMQLSPIDAAEAYAQRNHVQNMVETIREEMGLNDPLPVKYFKWLKGAVKLDFGTSFVDQKAVFPELMSAFSFTAKVILLAGVLEAVAILLLGCLCYACKKRAAGHIISILCFAAISIPPFFLASSLIDVFALKLGVIKVVGNVGLIRYLPASLCFTLGTSAFFAPLLSVNIEKEMKLDSAYYARCRGLSERRILFRYALPTALMAILPSFFQMMALSMAGAIIVEQVFSIPGLGYLIMSGVTNRDPPVVHAAILLLALVLSLFCIFADLLRRILNRRTNGLEGGTM